MIGRKVLLTVTSLALLGTFFLGVIYAQDIRDWWFLRSYEPTPLIAQLADEADMSDEGRELFYLYDPAVNNKATFNNNCPFPERSLVLGCYDGTNIYILDITKKQLEEVEEVTAAHEMLHAAYDRLSPEERSRIDNLLTKQLKQISDSRILETIDEYRKNDPDSLSTELHSILGTEVASLSKGLENHYAQYFNDRSVVVKTFNTYENVFIQLEKKIEGFDSRLSDLKSQIEAYEAELDDMRAQINEKKAELDALKANNQIEAYNSAVPGFNNLVNTYNGTIQELKSTISTHNSLVAERNNIALEQNELIKNLDSTYQPL